MMNTLPVGTTVDELGSLIQGGFADELKHKDTFVETDESRAFSLSTLERRIIKDSDQCPQCVANNDPKNVPVHPNCHCNVVTDSVETGVVEPGNRLLDVLTAATRNLEIEGVDVLSDNGIQLVPDTVAVFDAEDVRWADLARWLEQVQPYLENANTYVSIIVDEDTEEAAEQVEEVIDMLASDVETGLEALQTRKFWFAIAKAAI
jgi:hypothetical protein